MNVLQDSLLELIRRASAEIPEDVHKAIVESLEREKKGTIAESAMKIIEQNIAIAKNKSQPICQDTGSIIFYVDCPIGFDQLAFEEAAREGEAPVLVTSPGIRPFVRGIIERFRAQTSVLAQSEIHPRARLKTVASI